MPFALLHRTRC